MEPGSHPAARATPPSAEPLVLGLGLRPIVFGGTPGVFNAFAGRSPATRPSLVLGVHSPDRRLLGYLVINDAVAGLTWGGMTVSTTLTLDDALELAQATATQMRLFGLERGSHHGLVQVPEDATARERASHTEEYLDALLDLVRQGYCRIAFTRSEGRLEPRLASIGVAASAAAATLAALDHLGEEPSLATAAVASPTPLALEAAAAAVGEGLQPRVVTDAGADVDVLFVDRPLWRLTDEEARTIRARVVVSLGPVAIDPDAERQLHDRGVLLIPYAVAAAGLPFALDLRARGLSERTALARARANVRARISELLLESAFSSDPLPAVIRRHVS